jgi:tetratricopeptide (TPR) repeat protein
MLDRTEEAAAAFQRALEIQPTATVYSNLGTLRFFQGRYSDAAGAFEKAVEGNPTYFLYWANLGDAYRWIPGAEEKAKQAYSRAVTLADERVAKSPEDPNLRTQLAVYLAKRGDATRARQQLEVWNTLNKKTPASHFRAALVHEIVGDRNAALDALGAAMSAGYALNEIRGEPELAKLRGDPRYHRLVAAFETATPTRNPPTPKR